MTKNGVIKLLEEELIEGYPVTGGGGADPVGSRVAQYLDWIRLIEDLPEWAATVFCYRRLYGMTWIQIGRRLNISHETARKEYEKILYWYLIEN